ncbi:MAG: nicotinamide-nucleotide amidohydrolase family protein, partial [Candidatus Cybelea sp.]
FIFGRDDDTPASAIHSLLQSRGRRLATAESVTGGRIAAALTSISGSSLSFLGGVVAYDNAVKIAELDVRAETIARVGAVSEEVASEMARGVRKRLGADVSLATTGIAGPTGGSPEKPVGLVWFALNDSDGTALARDYQLNGEREAVVARATTIALGMLWRHLEGHSS